MARALTPKQERFAQLYVELGNASEAYRRAYPGSAKWTPESLFSKASRTLASDKVRTRVVELTEKAAKKTEVTREAIINRLASFAFDGLKELGEDVKPRDRVKALELLGKRFGLWIERHSHEGPRWQEIFDRLPVEVQEQIVKALDALDVPGSNDGRGDR